MVERIATTPRRLFVPDSKVSELRDELARIMQPGSWADNHTTRAFESKWDMTVAEACSLVGTPTWPLVWVEPDATA